MLILGAPLSSQAQTTDDKTLKIQDKAPTLFHIQKWMKRSLVPKFEKGKVYLVDVTWIACASFQSFPSSSKLLISTLGRLR